MDAKLFGEPVSIKTITSKSFSGVKLIWTVDAQKAKEFHEDYYPHCDILLVQIKWNGLGGFYYIPLEVQKKLFDKIGKRIMLNFQNQGQIPGELKSLKKLYQH